MVFSSSIFIFMFLPILLLLYFISADKYKNYILLIFSLIFYAWGGPKLLLLMFFIVGIDYIAAFSIERSSDNRLKKLYILITVISNVGLLGYYKYTMFIFENLNRFLETDLIVPQIILPIGISFFTFQAMSYVLDVYRGDVKAQKNPFYVLLYVALFPQLVAGPIVRYKTVENEIINRRTTLDDFTYGLERFILGFAKKLIIANNVGELADAIFGASSIDTSLAWLGAVAYALQIYFDFSAYSDMAIGLGSVFGFRFNENFNYPYAAKSITEFWRRWHISLSTWFRDYIYIPLGGNRKGKRRQLFNMFVVWTLTGMWHGASWNFIIWGLYYFTLLTIEKLFLGKLLEKIPAVVRWIYTVICVLVGWVIFRVEYMTGVIKYLYKMITFQFSEDGIAMTSVYLHKYGLYLLLGLIFSIPVYNWVKSTLLNKCTNEKEKKLLLIIGYACLLFLFGISVLYLVNASYNPFIYFRF